MSFAKPYRQLLIDARANAERSEAARVPSMSARVRAWTRQEALERRLLDGEGSSAAHSLLAVRAWQLTRPRARAQLARAWSRVLAEAGDPLLRRGASIPVCRGQVEVAREEIERVMARLRDPWPVRPQGMVMLRQLLGDGDGPLYALGADDELWRRVRRASVALG